MTILRDGPDGSPPCRNPSVPLPTGSVSFPLRYGRRHPHLPRGWPRRPPSMPHRRRSRPSRGRPTGEPVPGQGPHADVGHEHHRHGVSRRQDLGPYDASLLDPRVTTHRFEEGSRRPLAGDADTHRRPRRRRWPRPTGVVAFSWTICGDFFSMAIGNVQEVRSKPCKANADERRPRAPVARTLPLSSETSTDPPARMSSQPPVPLPGFPSFPDPRHVDGVLKDHVPPRA